MSSASRKERFLAEGILTVLAGDFFGSSALWQTRGEEVTFRGSA